MTEREKIVSYILSVEKVTVPDLMLRFSASYSTVRGIISDLTGKGSVVLKDGVEYAVLHREKRTAPDFAHGSDGFYVGPDKDKKASDYDPIEDSDFNHGFGRDDEDEDLDDLDELDDKDDKSKENGFPGIEVEPCRVLVSSYISASSPRKDRRIEPQPVRTIFNALFEPEKDEEKKHIATLVVEAEEEAKGREKPELSEDEKRLMGTLTRLVKIINEAEEGAPDKFVPFVHSFIDGWAEKYVFTTLYAALYAVKKMFETETGASVSWVEVSGCLAVFFMEIKGSSASVKTLAETLFEGYEIREKKIGPEQVRVELTISLPKALHVPLDMQRFVNVTNYFRKRKLLLPIGQTHDESPFFCNLDAHDLLITSERGDEGAIFLHGVLAPFTKKYSPERVRLLLAEFGHSDMIPYEELPHSLAKRAVTTEEGLFNLLELLNGLPASDNPKVTVCILCGLPRSFGSLRFKDERRARFGGLLKSIHERREKTGVRLILSLDPDDTWEELNGLFDATLCFREERDEPNGLFDVTHFFREERNGPADPLLSHLQGGGDAVYTEEGKRHRLQAFSEGNLRETIKKARSSFHEIKKRISIDEPEEEVVRLEPPEPIYLDALELVLIAEQASISLIQRRLGTGYAMAGKIIEWMERLGFISPFDGTKHRSVYITKEIFASLYPLVRPSE